MRAKRDGSGDGSTALDPGFTHEIPLFPAANEDPAVSASDYEGRATVGATRIYEIDPLRDRRWDLLVEAHPESSLFHTSGWLQALCRSYGYEAVAYTTSAPGDELTNAVVFCRVKSWLTGSRLVSLPFSDHCQPLRSASADLTEVVEGITKAEQSAGCKYVELRPRTRDRALPASIQAGSLPQAYVLHTLDLRHGLLEIFRRFHKDCTQRKIRRAEREGLVHEVGRSETLLKQFYRLLIVTRKRHGLPPQPFAWFRNLLEFLKEKATVHVASKDGRAIASILTILHKDTLTYKYGCSDARFHNLGGMPFLFWKAIQEAKAAGLTELDLGRSEVFNTGLVNFKENLGADSVPLTYYRLVSNAGSARARTGIVPWHDHAEQFARKIFARMPPSLLSASGRLLYRHLG
jgi:hypothetical protein